MVVVVRSYWPQSLYCQMDKTGDCGRTSPQRNIHSDIPFLKIQGKGGKERMAPLAEEAIPLIKTYLTEYHGSRPANNTPFIYTVQHGHVSRMSERNV